MTLSNYTALNGTITSESIVKNVVIAQFEVPARHLSGDTEDNHEKVAIRA
jgi:hypothetical protein